MAVPPISPAMLARLVPGHALVQPKEKPMPTFAHIAAEVAIIGGTAIALWAAWPARAARDAIRRALRGEGTR